MPDIEPPDRSDPNGIFPSPKKVKKLWAEIVHDDIKKVMKEEVDRMAEDFKKERKKWIECKNIIQNDYGLRRRYIKQLREMQSKNKKEELKYSILKVKIKAVEDEDQPPKESDIAKNHSVVQTKHPGNFFKPSHAVIILF